MEGFNQQHEDYLEQAEKIEVREAGSDLHKLYDHLWVFPETKYG